jgi:Fur family peroxide stress response transcriptional regulator
VRPKAHEPTPPAERQREPSTLASACRTARLHLTPQREAIYQALLEAKDHPSPEAIYRRVRGTMPSLSLATVYKTLEALVGLGLASELPATGKKKRYDANMDLHHHLVCTRCNTVADCYDAGLDTLAPPAHLSGFTVHRVTVQIHGLCETCARTALP